MSFYSPWALTGLITVPVIIVLYLLKQRHKDYTVSSLFLWEEVLKDMEANAPWQKLRNNILMILQIIAAILLVLSLAKPVINVSGDAGGHVVIAIQNSFSMKATDIGESRFNEAKKRAGDYIANLKPGVLVTLVSYGSVSKIEENQSNNRRSVLDKLANLKASNGSLDGEELSGLIGSVSKQYPQTQVVIFGDKFFDIPDTEVEFVKISNNGGNYGIDLLSHTKNQKGITVLGRISNYSNADASIPVSLYVDGKVFDAKNVDIKKDQINNVYWNNLPLEANTIEMRIDKEDSLLLDNMAYNVVTKGSTKKILLVSKGNVFLEKVISLYKGVELYKSSYDEENDTQEDMRETMKGYDLYIFDGFTPKFIPEDGGIMIFNPTENDIFQILKEVENPELERLDEEIFKFSEGFDFSFGKARVMKIPLWGKEIMGFKEGAGGFTGVYEDKRFLVLGFDVHNTDMPLTAAFPIMVINSIEWLMPNSLSNSENVYCQEGIQFNIDPKTREAYVLDPSGDEIPLVPPFSGKTFDNTNNPGVYTLVQKTDGGEKKFSFAVNVPSREESDLRFSGSSVKPEQGSHKVKSKVLKGFDLQWILLWMLVLVLLIEWWVYTNGV